MSEQWHPPGKEPPDEWHQGYAVGALTGFAAGLIIGAVFTVSFLYFALEIVR